MGICSPAALTRGRGQDSKKGGPAVGHGGRLGFAMDGGAPMLLRLREEADEVWLGSSKLPVASASPGGASTRRIGDG
jgi:hypothetical protein